jgi:hypothetical protein
MLGWGARGLSEYCSLSGLPSNNTVDWRFQLSTARVGEAGDRLGVLGVDLAVEVLVQGRICAHFKRMGVEAVWYV